MPQNRLILRQTASPYIFPLSDIVKGSVLSWDEVDGNFIFLKGLNIQSAAVSGSDIVFNRIDGNTFSVDISSLTGGTTGVDVFVTGGTYNNITGDATFTNNTGGTFTVTGFTSGISSGGYVNNIIPSGTTITVPQNQQYVVYGNLDLLSGGTLDNLGDIVIVNGTLNNVGAFNNSGSTTFVSFPTGDTYVTGFTFNPANYDLSLTRNDNITLTQNLSILASDLTVTGGTYNPSTGVGTFTNNTGGTFNVTGFLTGYTDFYTTGATLNGNTVEFDRTDVTNAYSVDLSSLIFTGNTSGTCINDIFVTNIRPCSGDSYFIQGDNVLGLGINGSAILYQNPLSANTISSILIGNTGNDYTINQSVTTIDGLFASSLNLSLNSVQLVYKTDQNNLSGLDLNLSGISAVFYGDSGNTKNFTISSSYDSGSTVNKLFDVESSGNITCPSNTGAFTPPILTSAERNLLTPVAGMMIYNSSTNRHQGYNGSTWNDFY